MINREGNMKGNIAGITRRFIVSSHLDDCLSVGSANEPGGLRNQRILTRIEAPVQSQVQI